MDLLEALKSRRSVRKFKDQAIDDQILHDILQCAPWVPNHHVSEPWRFIVVTGQSLQELADLRYQAVLQKRQGQDGAEARAEKARQEFLESPVVIVAVQRVDENPVRQKEDYAAMALSCYNIILAAWNHGIGSYWHTGPLVTSKAVADWLNLAASEEAVAFLRLGYPAMVGAQRRTPIDERIERRS